MMNPVMNPVRDACPDETETVTASPARTEYEQPLALYVGGPTGSRRHLLAAGVTRLGRGAESQIVLDDPRVSRAHALLEVGEQLLLSDLGSANGTHASGVRLQPGEARQVLAGQTFFIGDSALVVRPASLGNPPRRCFATLEELRAELEGFDAGREADTVLLLEVRSLEGRPASLLAAVLGELLCAPHDWMLRTGRNQLLLGLTLASTTDAPRLEREALQRLFGWSIGAEAEWCLCSLGELRADPAGVIGARRARAPHALGGGSVVLLDPAMQAMHRTLLRVAPAPVSVLILGETGSGKDVVASMLHELSPRAHKSFVRLNCATVPEQLLESELFGHERGAFTSAVAAKQGLLEAAEGGSVFLDEIGDVPLALQAKLLRVLESGEVQRLGSVRSRKVDVRFIAATNRDLTQDVEAGHFRRDLYYRLNCVTLTLPPLRERPTEIEPLARLFLARACERFELSERTFSAAALTALKAHSFPGNVRELRNLVDRATLLSSGPAIEPQHFGLPLSVPPDGREPASGAPQAPVTTMLPDAASESERIQAALARCGGNQSRAAKLMGIARRTLVRRMSSLGLPRPRAR
jgi:two-component system response regulator AtoC